MIISDLKEKDLTDYAPVPFWSWNNKLEKEELVRQIDEMKSVGCGGFVLHARTGLKTEYLSDEWFALVEICLDAAKERGMHVWIYDENGWPSGFVGGKLLRDEYLAQYLLMEEQGAFDSEALAVFVKDSAGYRRVTSAQIGVERYYAVFAKKSPSNTDVLNPALVEEFIACTHEEYYKHFSDRFGKELRGFFTDEPQFFRGLTPYAPALKEYFRREFGEDVLDGLVYLFGDEEAGYPFREKYYIALNRLYVQTFYRRLYEWCEAHGCQLTGHSIEENFLFTQMWGSAGVSTSYEFEHVPGIDNLTLYGSARLSARQIGSVAEQLGKKQILTETFGCSGFAATPKQLKAAAEKQYVHGVNLMCHHLFSYSLAAQGKVDHPPCFSRHMTWWKQFPDFNRYFTRLGYLLAESHAQVNCVVLSAFSSVLLPYTVADESRARKTDEAFERLQNELNAHGILYELADEEILLRHGGADGAQLTVGARSYNYVVVPACENLSANTKRVLEAYAAAGGKLVVRGRPRYTDGISDDWDFLSSNASLEEIAQNGAVKLETDGRAEYTYRKGDGFEFLYLVNPTAEPARVTIPEGFSRIDLLALTATNDGRIVELAPGEGKIFSPEKGEMPVLYGKAREVKGEFVFAGADLNNLTLDSVRVSTDGVNFGEEEPLAAAFDRLLRAEYQGKLFLNFTFDVKDYRGELVLRREKEAYLRSTLNGVPLEFVQTSFDVLFEEADVSHAVQEGKNEYICELDFYESPQVFYALFSPDATESMRNCLAYDTMLENVYLRGKFCVDESRVLVPAKPVTAMNDIQKQGYPFFSGEVCFRAKVFGEREKAKLAFEGDFCGVEVFVNGESQGSCFANESVQICLTTGRENDIELRFTSTLRNTFGPLHWAGDESAVGPYHFTMRGGWKDGKCEHFTPEYKIRPFGINSVKLSFGE